MVNKKRRAGPHAKNVRAVDVRRGRSSRRENIRARHRRATGSLCSNRLCRHGFKFRIRPVRVIVRNAVARIADFQQQRLHAGKSHLAILGRSLACITPLRHSGLPSPITKNSTLDTLRAVTSVIHADTGGKSRGAAVQIDVQ